MPKPAYTRLIMLGTAFDTHGGISAVVNVYREHGLFERWPIDYVATHCDGSVQRKVLAALRALLLFIPLAVGRAPAILHVHSASRASFWRKAIFMTIGLAARCPIVLHLHGGGFLDFYERECSPLKQRVVRFFFDQATYVLVLSPRWRERVAALTRNPNIICLPNPVPRFPSRSQGAGKMVLFLGRLERQKGIFDLLEAVAAARMVIPDITLVCAGDGDCAGVMRRAAELGIDDAVILTGWIDAKRRQDLLMKAAVFVLPSYAEGLPMSLLEAMAAGLPVIATDTGGIPDAIEDWVNGVLIRPGDIPMLTRCLRRLLIDRKNAQRLGASARISVRQRFDVDCTAAGLDQLYGKLGLMPRACAMADSLSEVT